MRRAGVLQDQAAKEFFRALNSAKSAAKKGKPQLAVDWCRYAAAIALRANPGFVYSHELERLLAEISRKYLGAPIAPPRAEGPPRRFLHLMTVAYEKGGHTRAVSRWIETCARIAPDEQHSVLISKQGETPLPPWLARAAKKTGGELFELPPLPPWLQAAAAIRTKSLEFDVIVLHTHPDDPLPNLALLDQPGRVILFNHADHVFILGMDVAHVVADLRRSGQDLTASHRAREPWRCLILIPLVDDEPFPENKTEARRRLGLPLDAPIALTIGDRFRYQPALGYSFPEALNSICLRNPDVLVVAVGIAELDRAAESDRSTVRRIRPVGSVLDPDILDLYYASADIYLDCFPSGSGTAVLDAARRALPVQRLNNPYAPILRSDDLALDSILPAVSNQGEYVAGVIEWLQCPDSRRSELGQRLRAAVLHEHCGESWKKNWLNPALELLKSPRRTTVSPTPEVEKGERDCFLALAALPKDARPVGMFVAATILEMPQIHWRIRVSGLWRSILPCLFDTAHSGTAQKRFSTFKDMVETVLPRRLGTVGARFLHFIFKKI